MTQAPASRGTTATAAAEDEVFVLPASSAQKRMWLLARLAGESAAYNSPLAVRLLGALDAGALTCALEGLVRRHEVLRTTFPTIDGEPVQLVRSAAAVEVPLVDLFTLPEEERAAEAERVIQAEARRPFDLARGPLLRALLIRLAPDEHVALCTLHHIVSDGWSQGVLRREIAAGYAAAVEGRSAALPDLPLQYADFAAWQREWLKGPECARQLAYWTEKLDGAPVLDLPADRPRPEQPSFRGASHFFRFPAGVGARVRELGARHGATSMMTMLAAFKALLARYTGQADVVVGTPVAGRNRRELEDLIGLFVNTLALRTDVGGDPAFAELVERVRDTVAGAQANQDLPFDRVADALRAGADPRRNPLFEVIFAYTAAPRGEVRLPGVTIAPAPMRPAATRFDLELHVTEGAGEPGVMLVYRTELFDAATIERMAAHYTRLLEAAAALPGTRISGLPMLGDDERRTVVEEWNATAAEYPADRCIHELVAAQAERTPQALALVCGEKTLTYREMDYAANRLANHLRRRGAGPEVRVGICLARGAELVVAIMAVLKAGAAYVPLDPAYPAERLAFMLSDSGARVLVTVASQRGLLPAEGVRSVLVDADAAEIAAQPDVAPRTAVARENAAYVIYTSGSTGRPKGVVVQHGSLSNLLAVTREAFGVGEGDVMPALASYAFDIWLFEALLPLTSGAAVRLVERERVLDVPALLEEIADATLLHAVPALMRQVVQVERETPRLTRLRRAFVGGDRVAPDLLADMREALPGTESHVLYGPTEGTVLASTHPVPEDGIVKGHPIGRPLGNVRLYVCDALGSPQPAGVAGELLIGGAGVARGYLGRGGLTAERFVPDPLGREPGTRLYRTGDRARWRADGTLEFLGRTDFQVKIQGFRIELGEIEAAILGTGAVAECAVIVREDAPGDRRLAAYLVGAADLHVEALREHLRRTLPDYMVPGAFVPVQSLPLTQNGKLDRRALPAPDWAAGDTGYVAPRTPVEEALAAVWAEVLGVERVGVQAGFFDVGGNSLLVMRVAARVRAAMGIEVPFPVLFSRLTVAALAEWIRDAGRENGAAGPIPRADRSRPLPLSFPQERLWFLARAEDAGASYTVPFGVRIRGEGLDADALERAFATVIERHEVLRTVFPAVEGEGRQVVLDPAPFALPRLDLRDRPEHVRGAEVARRAAELAERPYDLERGPLLRALLARTADDEHVVLLNVHHVVFDGWSAGLLVKELTACYRALRQGGAPELPELTVQYADYAAWQRAWMAGPEARGQLAFWKRRLAALPTLDLSGGRPRPERVSYRGRSLPVQLGPGLSDRVRALAREGNATLFMLLLAAFKVVLAHHARVRDLVVGVDVAGRGRAELEPLIGFFINEVVLRTDLSGDPAFADLLARVREGTLEAYRNQDVPFSVLVRELGARRDPGRNPLFQVMFGLDNTPRGAAAVDGLQLSPLAVGSEVSVFELCLYMSETPREITGALRYRTDLFDAATVEAMRAGFTAVLERACADPGVRLEALLDELEEKDRALRAERARAAGEAGRVRFQGIRRTAIPITQTTD